MSGASIITYDNYIITGIGSEGEIRMYMDVIGKPLKSMWEIHRALEALVAMEGIPNE